MLNQETLAALDRMPGAEVICPDGTAGQLEMLGVRPHSDEITHLIVRRGFLFQRDLLVPADLVEAIAPETNTVQLTPSLSEVAALSPYEGKHEAWQTAVGATLGGVLGVALSLATLPLRLPFEFFLRGWQQRRQEAQDRIVQAARRARAQDLLEHRVFDRSVAEPPLAIDLNRASAQELAQVRGIGAPLADEIIRHRPFASFDQLAHIPGLSASTLSRLKEVGTIS
ncbi:MAG TPA: helix-hairpin-helix domain-containing protein [Pantanalinema sp.]